MKKSYDEIMEKIEVTDDMRNRILIHIQQTDLNADSHSKVVRLSSIKRNLKRNLSIAACFAILLAGALTAPHLLNTKPEENPELSETVGDIIEVSSAKELSETVGFEINDITNLPFTVESITYTAYWKGLAEIRYNGHSQSVIYRKSISNEDNSGDYNIYEHTMEVQIGRNTVLLKGADDSYSLAIWQDDTYSYSLNLSNGISEKALTEIVEQIE